MLFAVIAENETSSGINANITIFKKHKDAEIEAFRYDNKFTIRRIETVNIADTPRLQEKSFPESYYKLANLISYHGHLSRKLNDIMIPEGTLNYKKEIDLVNEYINELDILKTNAQFLIHELENQMSHLWLSIDENIDDTLDLALFYDKDVAKSYLSCRFMQALKKLNYREDMITKAKETFAKNGKTTFTLDGSGFACYGKIIKVKIQ